MKSRFAYVMIPLFVCTLLGSALAVQSNSGRTADPFEGKRVCTVLKESVDKGEEIKKIVKTGIEMGYSACYVVKCAIAGGGNLGQIISGAVEAGATPDVISRCAVDAGADAEALAKCLTQAGSTSLCYFRPEGLGYSAPEGALVPIDPLPARAPAGAFLSPSGF